ncbi:hypothetical protein [Methylocaldum szegediense]|uniref:Uncharacterized protein n=1 Tax=Methylocaldum szegediense TaxID=73780 RepID=A0ABN8X1L1_9GAMM|nr:hypothetical protein [Methylocaldum szegediense]CAI8817671.1 conserved protein of unknown function [Methylocaldum szegediense]
MSTTMTLPIEIYDILEHHFGHEDSRKVAQAIEASLTLIETRSIEVAQQKKLEIIEELRKELASKEDLLLLKESLYQDIESLRRELLAVIGRVDARIDGWEPRMATKADLVQLDKKFTIYFLVLLFAILIVNKDAITLLGTLLGLTR